MKQASHIFYLKMYIYLIISLFTNYVYLYICIYFTNTTLNPEHQSLQITMR